MTTVHSGLGSLMRPVSASARGRSWLELQKLTQEHASIFVHLEKAAGPFTHRNVRIRKMVYSKGDGEDYFGGARGPNQRWMGRGQDTWCGIGYLLCLDWLRPVVFMHLSFSSLQVAEDAGGFPGACHSKRPRGSSLRKGLG